jgi:lipoate---protein ligase
MLRFDWAAPMTWRVIDTGLLNGAENMAWDEALLQARCRGLIPDTLRYLRFTPPVALVGYHQAVSEEIRSEYCRAKGIQVNRRVTGGGAIYFDEGQLGWELICSRDSLPGGPDLAGITQKVCQAAARGLQTMGLPAEFRPRNDIEVDGRKISGTGAVLEGDCLLFQGTLLIDFNLEHLIKALRIPTEKLQARELSSAGERVTSLKELLGAVPPLEMVKEALEKGFKDHLGLRTVPGGLGEEETTLFRRLLPRRLSQEWIDSGRRISRPQDILRSIHKEEGGLIRTAVKVDRKRGRISDILITGDFFIHPKRAVYDLEMFLKGRPIRDLPGLLEDFFRERQVEFFGLGPRDFSRSVTLALDKCSYPELGFTLEEADHLTTFHGTLEEILAGSNLLLLPYCAKQPDCEYRFREGCDQCGACTVGEAYALAGEQDLEVKTIQNYEHLVEELTREKEAGIRGYIGCCCDAFQLKRQEAFKKAGLPGLLLDIENTTCYELKREEEAYRGSFETQTHLRLDLLKKVLEVRKSVRMAPEPRPGKRTGSEGSPVL